MHQSTSTSVGSAITGTDAVVISSQHTSGLTDKFRMAKVQFLCHVAPASIEVDAVAFIAIADADYSEAEVMAAYTANQQGLNDKVDAELGHRRIYWLTDGDGNPAYLSTLHPTASGTTVINKTFQEDIGWNVWLINRGDEGFADAASKIQWVAKYFGKYFS